MTGTELGLKQRLLSLDTGSLLDSSQELPKPELRLLTSPWPRTTPRAPPPPLAHTCLALPALPGPVRLLSCGAQGCAGERHPMERLHVQASPPASAHSGHPPRPLAVPTLWGQRLPTWYVRRSGTLVCSRESSLLSGAWFLHLKRRRSISINGFQTEPGSPAGPVGSGEEGDRRAGLAAWSCSPLPTLEARLPLRRGCLEARTELHYSCVRCPRQEPGPGSGRQSMGADAARCLPGPGTVPGQPTSGPVVPVWSPLKTVP